MRLYFLTLLLLQAAFAQPQISDNAKDVYRSSEGAVFLVYVNDTSGAPTALGSAFLVAPRELITNAHVVEGGSPVLAVGPARIPLKVIRVDRKKDLALLSVDIDLTSKPLQLALEKVSPGEQIYAIGNPEGLEKTISAGIVSGLRNQEDRELIQITSPISHGSSGGPILNSKGLVVGVAVGMLIDGQNLNFAVPVDDVKLILTGPTEPNKGETTTMSTFSEVSDLFAKKEKEDYSAAPDSEYQQDRKHLIELVKTSVTALDNPAELRRLACFGVKDDDLSDDSIRAAHKLYQSTQSIDDRAILAYVIYSRASNAAVMTQFFEKDSAERQNYEADRIKFQALARLEAEEIARRAKGDPLLISDFVLAGIRSDREDYAGAFKLHTAVVTTKLNVCDDDLTKMAYQGLISESDKLKRTDDAERWFRRYAQLYTPAAYEWDSEGDRRSSAADTSAAADAYENAAQGGIYYSYDYCFAAEERYRQTPMGVDLLLTDGRACIDASAKNTVKGNDKFFSESLPTVYREMAEALERRGVYQQALDYIKESMSAKPEVAQTYDIQADILEDLQRYSECIASERQAIKLSDGKYSWMHLRLGNCYFDTENWIEAAASFRLAAESDKTDPVSAFDLGLSLQRQGYGSDATVWFQEALTRKPSPELRGKILRALQR